MRVRQITGHVQCAFCILQAVGEALTTSGVLPLCLSCLGKRVVGELPIEGSPVATNPPEQLVDEGPLLHLVSRAVDGDTLALVACEACGLDPHVRVLGIDSPEHGTPQGTKATAFSRAWLAKNAVRGVELELDAAHPPRDRYGRLLRHVLAGGEVLAVELVRSGNAVIDRRFPTTRYEAELLEARLDFDTAPPAPVKG